MSKRVTIKCHATINHSEIRIGSAVEEEMMRREQDKRDQKWIKLKKLIEGFPLYCNYCNSILREEDQKKFVEDVSILGNKLKEILKDE